MPQYLDTTGTAQLIQLIKTELSNTNDRAGLIEMITRELYGSDTYTWAEINQAVGAVLNGGGGGSAGTVAGRTVTYPMFIADWTYDETNGTAFTAEDLADALDDALAGWRDDASALAFYNEIIGDISSRTIDDVELTRQASIAFATAAGTLDDADKTFFSVSSTPTEVEALGRDTYLDLGTVDTLSPTLPSSVSRTDEFLFTFTVGSSWSSITLPSGVVMADGFDWSEADAGVTFQVSIQDGVCAYLCVTPTNP